jgi:hypothetical protein
MPEYVVNAGEIALRETCNGLHEPMHFLAFISREYSFAYSLQSMSSSIVSSSRTTSLALLLETSKHQLHGMSFTLAIQYGKRRDSHLWLTANILAREWYVSAGTSCDCHTS